MSALLTLAADNPISHVIDHPLWVVDGWWLWSANMTNLVISAAILLILGPYVANKIATGPESEGNDRYLTKNPFASMIEVICTYLRDTTIRPLLHERTEKYLPFLLTAFFFILVNNLIGLVPLLDIHNLTFSGLKERHLAWVGGTATQNLWITGAMALISAIVFNIGGLRSLGVKGYMAHMTGGVPMKPMFLPVILLVVVIELCGALLIKPAALAIRLMANMTAGHILLAVLLGFPAAAFAGGWALGVPVTLVAGLGAIAVYMLEIFVALLQAFVFMFLTTVFISQLMPHGHHDDEHGHEHGEGHAHAAAH